MARDFIKEPRDLKSYEKNFILHPRLLGECKIKTTLSWRKVKFDRKARSLIPATRGIYAFTVEQNNIGLPPHGYVMYIGIAGTKGNGSLHTRYMDYLGEAKRMKRPKIYYLLRDYEPVLYFHYAEVLNQQIDLGKLETDMTGALLPPCNDIDLPADIRKARKAF